MNQHCYRLRRHRRTGQLIPVADIHRGTTRDKPPRRAARRLLRLAGMLTALPALADIRPADPQVSVIAAANGVPIVNIAPPDSRGLSHNRFQSFDVSRPGAVLNNRSSDGRSQLAGHILRNPGLDAQATSILAEVTSAGPASRLAGTLEVAGQRAALIIANPNGISVDGLSTLNTSALTLSTGAMRDGPTLYTRQGRITVEAGGVNTDGLQSFDLVAQAMQINGPIGPVNTGVPAVIGLHAGRSQHRLNDGRIRPEAAASPGVAISAGALGAMYGASITLQATDSGAGVRLQGALRTPGDIRIGADGSVALADSAARGNTLITSGSEMRLGAGSGAVLTGAALTLRTRGHLDIAGDALANTLDLRAASLSLSALVDVQGHASGQPAAAITLAGDYRATASGGLRLRQGDAQIQAATIDNQGLIATSAGGLALSAGADLRNQGLIDAMGALSVTAHGAVHNRGALQGDALTVKADGLRNSGLLLAARQSLGIDLRLSLDNEGEIAAAGALDLRARSARNAAQGLLSAHTLTVDLQNLHNAGRIQARAGLALSADLVNGGDIAAGGRAILQSAMLANTGAITAGTHLVVEGKTIDNAGALQAGEVLQLQAQTVGNSGQLTAGTLVLDAKQLRNTGGMRTGADLFLTADLVNGGDIAAGGRAILQSAMLANTGTITAGTHLVVEGKTIDNAGALQAGEVLQLQAQTVDNQAAASLSAGTLTITSGQLHNAGAMQARDDVFLAATEGLRNTGNAAAGARLFVKSEAVVNSGTLQGQDLSLAATEKLANTGAMTATENLSIETADYRNDGGIAAQAVWIKSGAGLRINGNAPRAAQQLTLIAPDIHLHSALNSSASLFLQADTIENHASLTSAGSITLLAQGDIRNHDGALMWAGAHLGLKSRSLFNGHRSLIHAEAAMAIQASQQLRNDGGRIESGLTMFIDTPRLENLSRFSGTVRMDPNQGSHTSNMQYAQAHAGRSVTLTLPGFRPGVAVSSLSVEQGVIHAGQDMNINLGETADANGTVLNQGSLTADGMQRLRAKVSNRSQAYRMPLADYFRQVRGTQLWAVDSLAALSPLRQDFPTLYALLDHMFSHHDDASGWSRIFGLYYYKHSWLGNALAQADLDDVPDLARALGLVLGGDWRGQTEAQRSQRWAAFKAGQGVQDLPFYPALQTVMGGRLGTQLQGRVDNGENVDKTLPPAVDTALQQALEDARKHWDRPPPAPPAAPDAPADAPADAAAPETAAAPPPAPKIVVTIDGVTHHFEDEAQHQAFLKAHEARKQAEADAKKKAEAAARRQAAQRRQTYADNHERDVLEALRATLSNPRVFDRGAARGTLPTPYYETRVAFVDQARFYGSAYFFAQIGYTPDKGIYVSGDNYFDSTLIRREAERLMGAQRLRRIYQDGGLVRQLMDQAASAHRELGLVVGQPPTAEQQARLRDDIVWYVWQVIDGQHVLMPKVYLSETTLQASAAQRAAGGAAIVSAGDIVLDADTIAQKNALIQGGKVYLRAELDATVVNDDGVLGGVQADGQLFAQGRDLYIKGGLLSGQDVVLDARRDLDIITGAKTTNAGYQRDENSAIRGARSLVLRAGDKLRTLGASLSGDLVALTAKRVQLGEIRELSGQFAQDAKIGSLTYSLDTQASTQDQGKGTALRAAQLLIDVETDMAIMGGDIQAGQTAGKIGGHLLAAASASRRVAWQTHDSMQFVASGRAGAGGQEASFSVGTESPLQTQAGDGQMSGAELKAGFQIAQRALRESATTHRNTQLNLGDGKLAVGGIFDLGGADINADRALASAAYDGGLDITAGRIESHKYIDTYERDETGWSLFLGSKSTARSSLLDVATHAGVTAQQAAQGREVDPALTAAQVAGDLANLALNDTVESASGLGAEFSYDWASERRTAENAQKIGGSIRMRTLAGDLRLVGANFSGGKHVALQSAGDLTLAAAKASETLHSEQHGISLYGNATASCNAFQGACGAGLNATLSGSHNVTDSESLTHTHSHIGARQLDLKTAKDLRLLGARVEAEALARVAVDGKLFVQTLQDIHHSTTNGGDWTVSEGAAVNNRTIGTITANSGATARHEHDHSALSSQIAGIKASGPLFMTVKGDADLIGGAITASGPGSAVDISGKLSAREVRDYRDHDGGYAGGSVGISASTSMPNGSLSGGRIAGEQHASTLRATLDVGQARGLGSLRAADITGALNQDADKIREVQTDRQWAQNDISITISKLDAGGKKARQRREQGRLDGPLATDFKGGKFGHVSAPAATDEQTQAPGLTIKGYKGRIDVTPQGRKIPVEAGGLGRSDSSSSSSGSDDASSASDSDEAFDAMLAAQRQQRQRAQVLRQTLALLPGLDPAIAGQYTDNYLGIAHMPQAQALSTRETIALMHYTHASRDVNPALRGQAPREPARDLIATIDAATQKLIDAGFTNPGMVHRGQWAAPLEQIEEGGIYQESAMMSTSENVRTARDYLKPEEGRPALLHIAAQGARITALAGLDNPVFDSIQEVLIPRQTPLRLRLKAVDDQGVLRAVLEDAQAQARPDSGAVDALLDWPLRSPEGPRLPAPQTLRRHSADAPDLATLLALQSLQASPQAAQAPHAAVKRQASDPGEGPAPKEGRADRYGKRTIVLAGDDAQARQAAERLADKHPGNSELQQWLLSGERKVLRPAPQTASGPEKIQIVGHGGQRAGMPTIGGHTPAQLADALALAPLPPGSKLTLVSCDSGACPGQDARSQLERLLPQAQVKGYAGGMDVDEAGRKTRVDSGGLGNAGDPRPAPLPVRNPSLQAPAEPDQVFQLEQAEDLTYRLRPRAGSALPAPAPDGAFLFVVPTDAPDCVLCGASRGSRAALQDPQLGIDGHTSISQRKPVLYAGTFTLDAGRLQSWNNDSGHYLPPAALRQRNFSPRLWRLLPEERFIDFQKLNINEQSLLQAERGYETLGVGRPSTPPMPPGARALPPAPAADPLAAYLARPAQRERFDRLRQPGGDLWHFDWTGDPDQLPGTHEIFHRPGGGEAFNRFRNSFSPDTWVMQHNERPVKDAGYYATDAVLAQYAIVSQRQGFYGALPDRIVRHHITNLGALDLLNRPGGGRDLRGFLADTQNGRHTQRILDALGMQAQDMHWNPKTADLTVQVGRSPHAETPLVPWTSPGRPGGEAGTPAAEPPAAAEPPSRYDFRIVGYQEDDARGAEAARRLFAKHPGNAMLVRFDEAGDFMVEQRSPEKPAGLAKLQLVGHRRDGQGPNLGGADGRLLAEQVRALDDAYGSWLEFGKITLVGCNTGACPGSGLHEAFRRALPYTLRHRTVGYDGLIDVTPDGRKVPVTEGGLGPKRPAARPTAKTARPPAAGTAGARPAATGTRPPATGTRPTAAGTRPAAAGARPKTAKPAAKPAAKTAKAEAPADVLAGYLADPSNKQRFDFVLSEEMSNLDLSDHPYYQVEGMHTIKTQDKGPEHYYANTFTPDTWTLLPPSQRPRHEKRYNTSDVILAQYLTAARESSFEDRRPDKLVFMLDTRDRATPFRTVEGDVDTDRFLEGTRAGKQAQRLLEALDLTIDQSRFDPLIDRLVLQVSARPGASTTDILSRHLAQPERRQAMDLLQQAFITQRQDQGRAAEPVGGTYVLSDLPPDQPINVFVNSFSPDRWLMHQNWRQNAQRPYFANDVVLAQYSIAAKAHGYYGRLPSTIVRDNIVNETSLEFFATAGARPDLQGFLTKTPNGKHTQRILDGLGMYATGLQWLPEDRQAIISVRPKDAPAKPKAAPVKPKDAPAKAPSHRPAARQ
ncbi:C80 family cysteine peptidase [Bordetella pseudohinzii]|uniref:Peptidase C80 domain-containing protein n=1 Tax=Bordetella pseudohinzii TaxID=1331258 RepID=A0ABN4RM58_9BORD|nr:C80 family cysteine peptidase [Bordetella pseudohinzii]ANY15126.1 hypothetical protein BBN53_04000 [Bordetella pseudohinzii]KMM26171.1 hypothetical protein L540_16700 [Bordetella pseudohinzii]KXA80034.1 hypothetical protein AW878_08615 [Bordetella pseudohinzii]KXA82896.1 hypothetical protein AW877_02070 [Bordetella pseudohinzii]